MVMTPSQADDRGQILHQTSEQATALSSLSRWEDVNEDGSVASCVKSKAAKFYFPSDINNTHFIAVGKRESKYIILNLLHILKPFAVNGDHLFNLSPFANAQELSCTTANKVNVAPIKRITRSMAPNIAACKDFVISRSIHLANVSLPQSRNDTATMTVRIGAIQMSELHIIVDAMLV